MLLSRLMSVKSQLKAIERLKPYPCANQGRPNGGGRRQPRLYTSKKLKAEECYNAINDGVLVELYQL